MTARIGLIVVASLVTASVAHAEDVPSNAELFRMLKAQQQTISELRAELHQARQERRAAGTSQRREAKTAAKQAEREAAREAVAAATPAQALAMYSTRPAALPARGAYFSIFGGGGRGGSSSVTQLGTAFFLEIEGGPLSVQATGRTNSSSVGVVGAHVGHEWSYGPYLLPALELEGLYLSRIRQHATLNNSNVRLAEQTFDDTFPTQTAVVLANAVVGFRTPYQGVTPYIGGGMGAAHVSIKGATSAQTNPPEVGINHFNSGPDSSVWGFAAQAKAGVRVALGHSAYVFGEYRYLYVGSTDQTFGPTVYPTHVTTSQWAVRFGDTSYQLAVGGVGVDF